jgi:translocation and assembly module TamB
METRSFRRRLVHLAWSLARGASAVIAIGLVVLVGAISCLDLPSVRRLATKELNALLASSFVGTVTVEQIAGLGIFGARGVTVQVHGRGGKRLLYVRGVRVSLSPFRIVRSLVFGKGEMRIDVNVGSIDDLDANLDADGKGDLELSHAFDSKTPSRGATASGRGLRLSFPRVSIGHAWLHGTLAGAPPVDADVDGLQGSLLVAPDVTEVDIDRLTLVTRALPMDANAYGKLEAHVVLPFQADKDSVVSASFLGAVGGIPTTAHVSLVGKKLDAVVDAPEVTAARVRALLTEAPVYEPLFAHAEVHGELSDMHATALVGVGRGRIDLDAYASVGKNTTASVRIEATRIDVRAFAPKGPHSSVGATANVRVQKPQEGALTASFVIDVPVGHFGDQVVPRAVFRGDVSFRTDASSGAVGLGGHVSAEIDEKGAPTRVDADLRPSAVGEQIGFDVRTDVPRLDLVRRLGNLGRGRVGLEANGKIVLASPPILDAAIHAQLEGFARGANRIRRANVKVLATGQLLNPGLKTSLEADGVEVASYRFAHVGVATEGLLDDQDVMLVVRGEKDFPVVEGRAIVETKDGLAVHAASLWITRGQAMVALRIREAKVRGNEVVVEDAVLDGLGSIARASFRASPERLIVHAKAEGLDLHRLGYALRMEDTIKDGLLAFDVDLDARRNGAKGHANAQVDHVVVSTIKDLTADVDLKMDGREVVGAMRMAMKDVASFDIRSDAVHIGGGGPLDASAWRKTWGKIVFSAQGDLGKLANMLPADSLPVSDVSGVLTMEGKLARDSETDDTPDVSLSAATRGFVVGTKSGPVEHLGKVDVISPPKSRTYDVDARLDVRVDGSTGFAEVASRLVNKRGLVLGVDAKSAAVPYKELMASFDGAGERLANVPFSATMILPGRKLEDLPPWLRLPGATGNVEGTLTVSGTADEPKVSATLKGHSLRVSGMTPGVYLDAETALAYDGRKGDVEVHVRSPEEEVLAASVHVDANVDGALFGRSALGEWTASAKGRLMKCPLAALAALSDLQVGGHVSGDFALDDLHKDARAELALAIGDLEVGTASFKAGSARITLDGHGLDASVRLDQDGGFAEMKASMGMTWGAEVTPEVDAKGATDVTLQAKHLRAVALLPFLQAQVSELDGNIDALGRFSVSGGTKPTMQGDVTWSDGLLQINALGEEFHAVKAKLSLSPDGVLRLQNASLSGPSGKVLVAGTARLDGLSLTSAEATVKIAKREALPLDLSGASMGQVYGDVGIKAQGSADHKLTTVAIDIPSLHVDLPLTSVSHVEDLGRPADEHVGYFRSAGRFILVPIDPEDTARKLRGVEAAAATVIELHVHLGREVEIRRGSTLKVVLEGDPSVRIAEDSVVRGQIRLKSGSLAVQGKKFDIEKGTVTFVGSDPSNPEVSVTAGWTAGDGTRVYADFIGPLKTGKVTLRSEPGRPKNEIVALILFGTADGSQSTPYASPAEDNATRVGTTAGGFATEGLSKGLDQLTGMEISTKIDTSNSANPRPEVEVQIAKDISVQLAFVLGTPPPGMNPDTTYASIDWRFVRNWSLETTFGNLGSTIADVIWQYRY